MVWYGNSSSSEDVSLSGTKAPISGVYEYPELLAICNIRSSVKVNSIVHEIHPRNNSGTRTLCHGIPVHCTCWTQVGNDCYGGLTPPQ
eukprot:2068666-Pleurochrysis_carterae.AAC.1